MGRSEDRQHRSHDHHRSRDQDDGERRRHTEGERDRGRDRDAGHDERHRRRAEDSERREGREHRQPRSLERDAHRRRDRDEERGDRDRRHDRKRHRAEDDDGARHPAPAQNGHEGRSAREANGRPGHGEVGNGAAVDAAPAAERWPKGDKAGFVEGPLPPPPADPFAPPAGPDGAAGEEPKEPEPEPDFALSGKLAAETNRVNGVVLLHVEPPEAAVPTQRWRLYQFKNGKPFETPLPIHRQSCYMFGRERRIADVPTDHPSCSKQQAVIQFRSVPKEAPDGMLKTAVRPYLMDLGSTNGTFLNGERIEATRFYELLEQDMIKFGNSSREYVLLHENSTGFG